MASLIKEVTETKRTGRIYTPSAVVKLILDLIGYDSPEVLGKTILDPACGDGQFLVEIVSRITSWSPEAELASNLDAVQGWDIDESAIEQCVTRLNEIIAPNTFDWKIRKIDSIQQGAKLGTFEDDGARFDFIVANPPYVRIQNLDSQTRRMIVENYEYCGKGATDLYLAFFELAFKMLESDGRAGFITPNSYLTTSAAKELRNAFRQYRAVSHVLNFGATQLFENASTYAAITVFSQISKDKIIFERRTNVDSFDERLEIPYAELQKYATWNFGAAVIGHHETSLQSVCGIHVGIQTLADKVFIFSNSKVQFSKENVSVESSYGKGRFEIEKGLLMPAVKASRIKPDWDGGPDSIMIWPYRDTDQGTTVVLTESELATEFPLGYKYLVAHKDELLKRDLGKPNPFGWFAFSRQQHLTKVRQPKLVFPSMVEKPFFVHSDFENLVVYSGYFINYAGNYSDLIPVLNSEKMSRWVQTTGRDLRGNWKSLSKDTIKEFPVPAHLITSSRDI